MAQATITNFFVNRKRPALDELKGKSKVMVMNSEDANSGYNAVVSSESPSALASTRVKVEGTVVFSSNVNIESPKPNQLAALTAKPRASPRPRRTTKPKDASQPGLDSFLRGKSGAKPTEEKISTIESRPSIPVIASESGEVKDEPERTLSKDSDSEKIASKSDGLSTVNDNVVGSSLFNDTLVKKESETDAIACGIGSTKDLPLAKKEILPKEKSSEGGPSKDADSSSPRKTAVQPEKKSSVVERARRELSLGDIRSKLTRSARLAELKASLTRFDDGRAKLNQIEQAKKNLSEVSSPSKPQLSQFNSIQLEVPRSPSKSPMKSPMKSPQKGHPGSRSPAFQRYSSLVQPGTPALALPYTYRHLAEVFRCVDTVVSLLFNRKEIITFEKLQPAVQEMSRKAFTQHHLAQMMTVLPEAFSLKQEKLNSFGSSSLNAKYHLVITPVFDSESGAVNHGNQSMTPSLQLERRRRFYNNLLELVKNHHEDFLKSLEPPLVIPRGSLTRWHPEFAVDQVPEVPASALPQPPNLEKCNSAKDVLACARQLYSCNPRMEKALENVAFSGNNAGDGTQAQNVHVEVVNSPAALCNPPSPAKSLQISAALKGIPKALLEKIRAKQAAKALEAMTRTSAQDKEACQYSRLPDLARILRNVFVTEKKGALQLETVLEKVGNSYGTALSPKELEEHLRLLAKAVPGWIKFEHLLKTDYVRLSKNGDMNNVMKRLDDLALVKLGSMK